MEGPWHTPTAPEDKVNRYQYNGKELNDDIGLGWYSFGAREYDPVIGRFTGVDPIADKFTELSTFNYASNNPVKNIDLHGLQGIHYMESLNNGTKRHVIEKNVIVLTRSPKNIPPDASKRKIARTNRQNARIAKSNEARIKEVRSELDTYYSGAKNPEGESVRFQFNVTGMEVKNTNSIGTHREQIQIANENGLEGQPLFEGGPNQVAPAAIVTTQLTNQSSTNGVSKKTDNTPGALAHEIGHTLMTRYQKGEESAPGSGGLMVAPPSIIRPKEVNKIIEDAIKKNN